MFRKATQEVTPEIPPEVEARLDASIDALQVVHVPDDKSANCLGELAVMSDLVRSVLLTDPDAGHHMTTEDQIEMDESTTRYLDRAREQIVELPKHRRAKFGEDVVARGMPAFLLKSLGVTSKKDLYSRLTATRKNGSYKVEDEKFLNFLQWHNYDIAQRREPFIEHDWPILKQAYIDGLHNLVDQNVMPPAVVSPLRLKRLDEVHISLADMFWFTEMEALAYANIKDNRVCLPVSADRRIVFHELSHVMEGRQKHAADGIDHGLARLYTSRKAKRAATVLNEAIIDQLALLLDGRVQTVCQDYYDLDHIYNDERHFLGKISRFAKKPLDIGLFLNACFEDSTLFSRPHISRLKRQLKKAYPRLDLLKELQHEFSDDQKTTGSVLQNLVTRLIVSDIKLTRYRKQRLSGESWRRFLR